MLDVGSSDLQQFLHVSIIERIHHGSANLAMANNMGGPQEAQAVGTRGLTQAGGDCQLANAQLASRDERSNEPHAPWIGQDLERLCQAPGLVEAGDAGWP